jgi:hypothetical protein
MLIGEYHGTVPDWRRTNISRPGELFGIELEVEHVEHRQAIADALDELDVYPAPIVERDGSLDPHRGLEVICPPLSFANIKDDDGYVARLMRLLREAGVPMNQRAGCGMHVNVNVVDWTPQEKLLVQWCLNAFAGTGRHVGRRDATTPGRVDGDTFGNFVPIFQYTTQFQRHLQLRTFPGGKHSAAWLRSPGHGIPSGDGAALVMEARFPKSTLEIKDLHAAIDYIMAVRDWIRVAPNHTQAAALLAQQAGGFAVMEASFVRWCLKYRPHVTTAVRTLEEVDKLADVVGNARRLELMTRAYEEANNLPGETGFRSTEHGDKEQILRISTLIGKGAELEGEPADEYVIEEGQRLRVLTRIDPTFVRARR